jgi:hypothetical protein
MSIACRLAALASDIEQKANQPNGLGGVETDLLVMLLPMYPRGCITGVVLDTAGPNPVRLTEQTGRAIEDELKRRKQSNRKKKGGG